MSLLNQDNALVLIVDIQEKLLKAVYDQNVASVAAKMASAAKILGLPVIITEQYPQGLGATVASIKDAAEVVYVEKTAFCAYENICDELAKIGRKQVILLGIEAHICVHQTADALLSQGYEVHVLKDGVASRKEFEYLQGLERMQNNGAVISCLEIALFELLKSAKHPDFKAIQALIK